MDAFTKNTIFWQWNKAKESGEQSLVRVNQEQENKIRNEIQDGGVSFIISNEAYITAGKFFNQPTSKKHVRCIPEL